MRQTAVTGYGWFGVSGLSKAIWADMEMPGKCPIPFGLPFWGLCFLPKISDMTRISNLSAFELELDPLRISSNYLKPSCTLILIW